MHLAEGTLPLPLAAAGWAALLPALAWGLPPLRPGSDAPRSPLLPAAAGLLFAATLLPLPVPGVGATSHLCLTPALALLLGPRALIWPVTLSLLLQALFFAHGGLTTLGANALTLGALGPAVALGVAGALRGLGAPKAATVGLACALGDLAVYLGDAAWLAAALAPAAPPARTFTAVVLGFAPIQGPLAVLEGVVSVALLRGLAARRADVVPPWLRGAGRQLGGLGAWIALVLLTGCAMPPLDEAVFAQVAEAGGRPPQPAMVDWSGGELGLAVGILAPFAAGFAAGRAWERLRAGPAPASGAAAGGADAG
jgi:cobalt/nickel transport system permease protein